MNSQKLQKIQRVLSMLAIAQKQLERLNKDEEIIGQLDGQPVECAINALAHLTEELEYLNGNLDNELFS